jgi:predicted PhzF superfamily epimerase YddE/YHI9
LARFETAEQVIALRPDFAAIAELDEPWIMATAPGTGTDADVDFVSRYFAPGAGINEDPVTGSAHCALGPYWARQLAQGTSALSARQVSERGGELLVMVRGDRVVLRGECVEFLSGTILVPGSV